jgi:hypothetical protein
MKGRRNNRGRQDKKIFEKKVIRCNVHQKPVFISETCTNFMSKHKSEGENNCKNCQNSF